MWLTSGVWAVEVLIEETKTVELNDDDDSDVNSWGYITCNKEGNGERPSYSRRVE
jgi:hypothetical protein